MTEHRKNVCLPSLREEFLATGKEGKCHYCKKGIGQKYDSLDNGYLGICNELLSVLHPFAMAFLYYGKHEGKKKIKMRCPATENTVSVTMSVSERLPFPLGIMKTLFLKILNIFISFDFPTVRINIKVDEVSGACPFGHKKGDKYYFKLAYKYNIFNERVEMCPAATFGIYPAMLFKHFNKDVDVHAHCPDSIGITYSITIRP